MSTHIPLSKDTQDFTFSPDQSYIETEPDITRPGAKIILTAQDETPKGDVTPRSILRKSTYGAVKTKKIFEDSEELLSFLTKAIERNKYDVGNLCKAHQLPKNFVCVEDQFMCCQECINQGEHLGHKCISFGELKERMEISVDELYENANDIRGNIEKIDQKEKELADELKQQADKYINMMVLKVKQHLEELQITFDSYKHTFKDITDNIPQIENIVLEWNAATKGTDKIKLLNSMIDIEKFVQKKEQDDIEQLKVPKLTFTFNQYFEKLFDNLIRLHDETNTIAGNVKKYINGDIYYGELVLGKAEGRGKLIYANGGQYRGPFKNDKPNGKGVYEYLDLITYEGEFKEGLKHGFGHLKINDGTDYKGEFVDDLKHGKGTLIDKLGNIYTGQFEKDKKQGKGVYQFAQGNKYEGDFWDDKYHGKGYLFFSDGAYYEGDFSNGVRQGKGSWHYSDGSKFYGYWKNDCKDGYGVYVDQYGSRYEGEYENDKKHGKGSFYYNGEGGDLIDIPNENRYSKNEERDKYAIEYRYEGEWRNDKKSGKSIELYGNGDRFQGNFVNGVKCGYGIYTAVSGLKYKGEYRNGMRDGQGVLIFPNGDFYVGHFLNNRMDGQGHFHYASGKQYEGSFKEDMKHGNGLIHKNGIVKSVVYEYDKKVKILKGFQKLICSCFSGKERKKRAKVKRMSTINAYLDEKNL